MYTDLSEIKHNYKTLILFQMAHKSNIVRINSLKGALAESNI